MKSLLQTKDWASLKAKTGWQAQEIDGVQIMSRKLPLGRSFFYVPEVSTEQLNKISIKELLKKIELSAKEQKAIAIRIEILEEENGLRLKELKDLKFQKSFEEIQPEHRQWIEIDKNEDQILAQMKPKGRYNIRVAQKHGIKVFRNQDFDHIKIFYELYSETAKREHFRPRPIGYFKNLLNLIKETNYGSIFTAYYKEKPLASLIITYYDQIASYLYGASSAENRNVMAPYLAHWNAIEEAKKRDCTLYDLLAVAPKDKPNHKYAGLSRFKQQFGGHQVDLIGSWDFVYQPFGYAWFKSLEKIRR